MTVQLSVAVRNAMLDAIEATAGTSALLRFYTGAQPANCAAAASGTKLAEYSLASDWASNAASGAKSLSSLPISTTGIAAGTAAHFRVYNSAGTTCHMQGSVSSVSAGTGDLQLTNDAITVGGPVNVATFTANAGNA